MKLTANSVKITRNYDQIEYGRPVTTIRKILTIESDLTLEQYYNEKQGKEYYYETVKANPIVVTVDKTTSVARVLDKLDRKTDWVYTQFKSIKCGWKLAVLFVLWEVIRPYIL